MLTINGMLTASVCGTCTAQACGLAAVQYHLLLPAPFQRLSYCAAVAVYTPIIASQSTIADVSAAACHPAEVTAAAFPATTVVARLWMESASNQNMLAGGLLLGGHASAPGCHPASAAEVTAAASQASVIGSHLCTKSAS